MNTTILFNVLAIILAYLVGSTPSALVIGKLFYNGTDIRKEGSGNLGTTNMLRVLGFKAAISTAAFDVFIKGSLVTFIALILHKNEFISIIPLYIGFASAIGHAFPIFAGFRGGKCVATTIGILLPINPLLFVVSALLLFVIFFITHIMSIGSFISLLFAFIYIIWDDNLNINQIIIIGCYYILILFLHRDNIIRIIKGEEKKVDAIAKIKSILGK